MQKGKEEAHSSDRGAYTKGLCKNWESRESRPGPVTHTVRLLGADGEQRRKKKL